MVAHSPFVCCGEGLFPSHIQPALFINLAGSDKDRKKTGQIYE